MSIMPRIMPCIEYHHMSIIPKNFIPYDANIDSIGIYINRDYRTMIPI